MARIQPTTWHFRKVIEASPERFAEEIHQVAELDMLLKIAQAGKIEFLYRREDWNKRVRKLCKSLKFSAERVGDIAASQSYDQLFAMCNEILSKSDKAA